MEASERKIEMSNYQKMRERIGESLYNERYSKTIYRSVGRVEKVIAV